MRHERYERDVAVESSVIGWISFAEVFLLGGIVLLATALFLEGRTRTLSGRLDALTGGKGDLVERVQQLEKELAATKERERRLGAQNAELRNTIGRLNVELSVANNELTALRSQNRKAEAEVAKLNEKIKQLDNQFSILNQDLRSSRSEAEKLAAKVKNLEEMLAVAEETVKEGRDALARRNADYERVQKELAIATRKYENVLRLVKDAEDRVLRPLDTAKLVVSISCDKLPDGLDLDLYVQDPNNRLCYWKQPRIMNVDSETGMLIPSEDLRTRENQAVEIFYSNTLFSKGKDVPYLVFAMLRTTASRHQIDPVRIKWEIKARRGAEIVVKGHGFKPLTSTGRVVVDENSIIYAGLFPICSFAILDGSLNDKDIDFLETMPDLPRGWRPSPIRDGSKDFNRIRDQPR